MNVGERIANNRKKLGYSQEQLAEKMNVSRQTVSKWENNTHLPELEKCMELSRLFQISLDELLLGEKVKDTGLSEEQFSRLLQEIKPAKRKEKKGLKIGLSCCLVLLLGKLIVDNNSLNEEINHLSNSLNYLTYEMNHQSSIIENTIQEAIQSNDSIISDFKTHVIHYDIEKDEVRVNIQIFPKEMDESSQMEVKFSNDDHQLVQGALVRHDNCFEKEFIFPLNNFDSVYVLLENQEKLQQMTFNPELFLLNYISLGLSSIAPQALRYGPKNNGKTFEIDLGNNDFEFIKETSGRNLSINGENIDTHIETIQYDIYLNQQLYVTQEVVSSQQQLIELPVQDGDEIHILLHYTDTLGLHYRELVIEEKIKKVDNNLEIDSFFVSSFSFPEIATQ